MNFYNEIDPYCCDWLENLIQAKLIPDGVVDRRSIVDLLPAELKRFTQCHFFAGLGGWPLALRLAAYPDHKPVWTGSCPCQPFSAAGKRLGFADDRHLWPWWRYLIAVCRPSTILGEQVASASAWLRLVRGDLEALEYAVGCMPVEAASAGADHLRDRFWFVAHDEYKGEGRDGGSSFGAQAPFGSQRQFDGHFRNTFESSGSGNLANGNGERQPQWPQHDGGPQSGIEPPFGNDAERSGGSDIEWVLGADDKARRVKSGVRLLVDALSGRVAVRRTVLRTGAEVEEEHWYSRVRALKALGNAIDPRPAAAFIKAALSY